MLKYVLCHYKRAPFIKRLVIKNNEQNYVTHRIRKRCLWIMYHNSSIKRPSGVSLQRERKISSSLTRSIIFHLHMYRDVRRMHEFVLTFIVVRVWH